MARSTHDRLADLHDLLVEQACQLIESGEATPKDREFALALVKNSGISAVPTASNALGRLAQKLNFKDVDEKVVPLAPVRTERRSEGA